MVVISAPSTLPIGTEQERIACPLTCTVQAPHCGDAAAEFRAGQPDLLAQDPEKRRLALDIELMRGPVDLDGDHDVVPLRPVFLPCGRPALSQAAFVKPQIYHGEERRPS